MSTVPDTGADEPPSGTRLSYPLPSPHPPPPSERPELPAGVDPAPRWPAWYGPLALVSGIVVTFIAVLIIEGVVRAASGHLNTSSPALNDTLTFVQDAIFVAVAVLFAGMTKRPRPWHFGLRGARLWPTIGWAALGIGAFLLVEVLYTAIVTPKGKQTVTQDLGANTGQIALIAGAFVVIVIAPIAEEIFFRGFFYRALRTRFNIWVAAAIDGVVFGMIHYTGSSVLTILPILAVLGFVFCLVYERTGTIFATIGLHAANNWAAYATQTHHGAAAASACGGFMLIACALAIARVPRVAVGGS